MKLIASLGITQRLYLVSALVCSSLAVVTVYAWSNLGSVTPLPGRPKPCAFRNSRA